MRVLVIGIPDIADDDYFEADTPAQFLCETSCKLPNS
jgi:hypothetical protein